MRYSFLSIVIICCFFYSSAQVTELFQSFADLGFENVDYLEKGPDLYITYENNLYRFEPKGFAVVIAKLSEFDLYKYSRVHFLLRSGDIPMVVASLSLSDLKDYSNGLINSSGLVSNIRFSFDVDEVEKYFKDSDRINSSFFKIDVPVGLELDYALGDYNDGLMTRIYFNPRVLSTFGRGMNFEFKFQNIVQNDIPGKAISSPIILKLNQGFRFSNNSFLSTSLGYLPQNKFGLHLRFRNYLAQERFYVELLFGNTRLGYLDENWTVVSNRNSDAIWQAVFNFRWNKFDTDFNLTYGTFYAGDLGYKLQFTRQFNEVYVNLFYARTDLASSGSFGSKEDGIIGFSLAVPFGQSKFLKPNQVRIRSEDQFDLLYRYSGFSFSGIDIEQGVNIFTDIREFYPEVMRKGLLKHLNH